ncbi:MAG TPA: helix-turn-helix domain-containing protein [Nitrososphaera sp.]|nr:helix-turn-helix domain-containing protein [Nitrososphaera sp.]
MTLDSDAILDILGNDTRRRILAALADEPMYFNQLAKEIDIGQQAMLRHVEALEKIGLIETYAEKSDFGAPNRKYYKLSSAFTLTISLSEDDFSITNKKIEASPNKESKKRYKRLDSTPEEVGAAVSLLHDSLEEIDEDIAELELQLNDLRALRQNILRRLHEIGVNKFEDEERRILYMMVRESPESITELSEMLDRKESAVREAIARMKNRMQSQSMSIDIFDKF